MLTHPLTKKETDASTTKVLLCRRKMARGDVLLTTAVLRALKAKYPNSIVYYETQYPDLLLNNPAVDFVNTPLHPSHKGKEDLCNFELRYEKYPGTHIIDCFALGAGFRPGQVAKVLEIFPDHNHTSYARAVVPSNAVIIAAGPGLWTGRNWSEANWVTLCRVIQKMGYKVVLAGVEKNYNLPCDRDLRGTTGYHQLAACIGQCRLFVGIDSFPFHVAGAMGVPRVGLFGITYHQLISCSSSTTVNVQSSPRHPLTGMRHRVNTMHRIEPLAKENNPMDTITVEAVVAAVEKQLNILR